MSPREKAFQRRDDVVQLWIAPLDGELELVGDGVQRGHGLLVLQRGVGIALTIDHQKVHLGDIDHRDRLGRWLVQVLELLLEVDLRHDSPSSEGALLRPMQLVLMLSRLGLCVERS